MNDLISWFEGKKTYFVAGIAIAYGVSAYFTGHIDAQSAIETILAALGGMSVRNAIEKK